MDQSTHPAKHPLSAEPDEDNPIPAKKPRTSDQPPQATSSSPSTWDVSDANKIMPEPSDTYIELRFQLTRFKGVYRVARLPLSFTFAHLYEYILLIFGWSGMHLHQAEVLTHVELYSGTYRPGDIKKHRSVRIPEEPDHYDDLEAWRQWARFYSMKTHDPMVRVSPLGKSYDNDFLLGNEPWNMDDPWERVMAETQVPCKKDHEVTLGDVWSRSRAHNISKGKCRNQEIGIKFEYDLGASWEVHITVHRDQNNEYMWCLHTPDNRPSLITAKGAPPSEDARSYHKEIEPKKKTVSDLLFDSETFERYLKGDVRSIVRNKELLVYEASHPPADMTEDDSDEEVDEEEEALADWNGPRYHSERPLSPYEDEGDGDEDEHEHEDEN
ncbi:hypothetical protein ONZ51_g312 [Trametes cubensis]|uniref:Plasmid pRiA4b Orf3-like domain-containing protein n=1 Tax=Trametes cubensis TaxID=1111947 RepID=A0AAD7U3R6_9APHY|nr:hypothetical protein ONZ51_g312 [Trametes cubensis]